MKQRKNVIEGYDKSARDYAENFMNELDGKPLDQLLLKRFVEDNQAKGTIIDLGCGPGQTTLFMKNQGASQLLGVDLSPKMIEAAQTIHKGEMAFEVGDMLNLSFKDNSFPGAICFYGIVHFSYEELEVAFQEIYRVLKPHGQFLFSFHIGNEERKVDDLLGNQVDMTFIFFEVEKVLGLLEKTGWKQLEVIERYPYAGVEYPSRRAYILVEKT